MKKATEVSLGGLDVKLFRFELSLHQAALPFLVFAVLWALYKARHNRIGVHIDQSLRPKSL
jgi:hypothetical protein